MRLRWGFVATSSCLLLLACQRTTLRSDAELTALFAAKKPEYVRLMDMFQADGLTAISEYGHEPKNVSLPSLRREDYKRLLDETEVRPSVFRTVGDEGVVFFCVDSFGSVSGGDSKGIAYSERPIEQTFENLDRFPEGSRGRNAFRHIEGGWYLFYRHDK